jgi:hypothetical protein
MPLVDPALVLLIARSGPTRPTSRAAFTRTSISQRLSSSSSGGGAVAVMCQVIKAMRSVRHDSRADHERLLAAAIEQSCAPSFSASEATLRTAWRSRVRRAWSSRLTAFYLGSRMTAAPP